MTLPVTEAMLLAIAPGAQRQLAAALAPELEAQLAANVFNNKLRMTHFLAQAAHETDGFRTLTEYASGTAYEGRADLGNTHAGDGVRYKGRGIFMITGRANYRIIGGRLDVPLEDEPERLLEPRIAVAAAIEFWLKHVLSYYADRDDVIHITRLINGGLNGLASRRDYLARAKHAFGV